MSVWKILTLPCEEASKLVSEGLDRELSRADRLALGAHMLSCRSCRRFRRHANTLRRAASEVEPMPPEAKDRVRRRLDEER
jgi:hypothetical protein